MKGLSNDVNVSVKVPAVTAEVPQIEVLVGEVAAAAVPDPSAVAQ